MVIVLINDVKILLAFHVTCLKPCNDVSYQIGKEELVNPKLFGSLEYTNITPEDMQTSTGCEAGDGAMTIQFGRHLEVEKVNSKVTFKTLPTFILSI